MLAVACSQQDDAAFCSSSRSLWGVWVNEEGSMCENREEEEEEEEAEWRMMGQVWNLHTLLVAHTIGIFALQWWVTLVIVEVRLNEGFWAWGMDDADM